MNATAPVTREKIDELLEYLPILNQRRDSEPEWRPSQKLADGTVTMPCARYSTEISEFFELASQPCWLDTQYDPEIAHIPLSDDAAIKRASLAEVKSMLTYCVRGERFCEGHWGQMIRDGRVQALLRRLSELRYELP
jgi:hypothetical protein